MTAACGGGSSDLTVGVISLVCRSILAEDPREELSWLVLQPVRSSAVSLVRASSTELSDSESFECREPGVENSER
jgi:hypothetical protein